MYYTDHIVNTDCDLGERAMNRKSDMTVAQLVDRYVEEILQPWSMVRSAEHTVQWGYLGFNPFTERCAESNEVSENVTAAWRMEHEPGKEEDHHLEN
jgi:hypothetical protein